MRDNWEELADNPVAASADDAVRHAIAEVVLRELEAGQDPGFVIRSVWTGALFAVAHLIWRFRAENTLDQLADATRLVTVDALHQVERAEIGGNA